MRIAGDEVTQVRLATGFNKERIGAESIGGLDGSEISGGADDNDESALQLRIFSQPAQEFESINARKLQVEENDRGQGKSGSVPIRRSALQVQNGLFTAEDRLHWIGNACLREKHFQQLRVVLVVFDNEDDFGFVGAHNNSNSQSLSVHLEIVPAPPRMLGERQTAVSQASSKK